MAATAICGNDITSSCLYVSAFAIISAGKWAPVALLMVAAVLYLFRFIYGEVVGALPLNGGAYNALLNTTSKYRASMAACLTILSYMATAVLSAHHAMHYVFSLLPGHAGQPGLNGFHLMAATIGLLAVFMVLTIIGITESSRVAIGIFITHLSSLSLLLVVGIVYVLSNGLQLFWQNLQTPAPGGHGLLLALFFGFSAAMLGVSGFESSANFVEEQARGVFPKTLRNMWIAVMLINPLAALLALALVPVAEVETHKGALLSHMGNASGGAWLSWLISINAALVLSGAVLTSYVGVNGLVRRMTLDRCLPQFLLQINRRGTTHYIVIFFFLLTVSILLITRGKITTLATVYTLSFLSVMALFGVGNVLLKLRRAKLHRSTRAPWPVVLLGIVAVVAALVGNAIEKRDDLKVFLAYFVTAMAIITVMLARIAILKGCLFIVRRMSVLLYRFTGGLTQVIRNKITEINAQQVVFFTRGDNIANLNHAVLYVQRNEHTNRIKVVTVLASDEKGPSKLKKDIHFLDEAYPQIDIELVEVEGEFGPKLISELSQQWQIPVNFMFMGSPGDQFAYDLAELGGVRLII